MLPLPGRLGDPVQASWKWGADPFIYGEETGAQVVVVWSPATFPLPASSGLPHLCHGGHFGNQARTTSLLFQRSLGKRTNWGLEVPSMNWPWNEFPSYGSKRQCQFLTGVPQRSLGPLRYNPGSLHGGRASSHMDPGLEIPYLGIPLAWSFGWSP